MSGMRTLLLALAGLAPVEAAAQDPLHLIFAGCIGRYSAAIEHSWVVGEDPGRFPADRLTFISLYEATVPEGAARAALHHRVASKMAQASLLTVARFHDDPTRAAAAGDAARAQIGACSRMLLES
ncbi:MAG: hypothetical protein AAGH73_00210 [Pseudomonadota bacterium]